MAYAMGCFKKEGEADDNQIADFSDREDQSDVQMGEYKDNGPVQLDQSDRSGKPEEETDRH